MIRPGTTLTAEDARWLREQCVHRPIHGCDCGSEQHCCDWCHLAQKVERAAELLRALEEQ